MLNNERFSVKVKNYEVVNMYLHCYIYKNVCQMARTMFYVHASKYGVFKNS